VGLLVPKDRRDEFKELVKALRQGKQIENYETTRRHRDGHAIEVSLTISPVRDKAGAVIGASAIARDITAHKRADALMSHLAAIVEASDDAIIGESLDGKITSWNSGAERIFGFCAEEVIGQPLSQLLTRGQTQQMAGIIKALRHGEHVEQIEATQLHKDGHAMEMSLTVSPVKDKAGKVIGASLIGRDITRRRRAEEALRQSEERFRVALQNAPVAVFNQDRKLRYTWVNSPTLAWAKQDCIGHTDEEIIGGKEGALLTEIKQEVLTSGRGSRTETQVTFEGEIYYFDMVVEPLRDARGNLLGITCTATDITSTKRSLLEREQLVAKLQEALDEVNMLSGMLSICASCKRITNERGEWERLESYLQTHSEAKFSHGVCPDCMRKLYPDYYPAEQENEFQR
jgi:PAS domain S-box-containing protein